MCENIRILNIFTNILRLNNRILNKSTNIRVCYKGTVLVVFKFSTFTHLPILTLKHTIFSSFKSVKTHQFYNTVRKVTFIEKPHSNIYIYINFKSCFQYLFSYIYMDISLYIYLYRMSLYICVKGRTLRMHGDAFLQLININIDINTLFTQCTHPRGYSQVRISRGSLSLRESSISC